MRCSQSIKIISEASDPYTSVYRAEALIMVEKRMLTARMASPPKMAPGRTGSAGRLWGVTLRYSSSNSSMIIPVSRIKRSQVQLVMISPTWNHWSSRSMNQSPVATTTTER